MTQRTRIEKLEMARPGVGDARTVFRVLFRPGPTAPIRCGALARTLSGVVYPHGNETEEEFQSRIIEEKRAGKRNDYL